MLTIKIHIDEETRRDIKQTYGTNNYATVEAVVNDIVSRYMGVEWFNPELSVEGDNYEICEFCGEKSKCNKMINVDGKNLEEHNVCENCGSGHPTLK